MRRRRARIGLVVPDLEMGGGVSAVAEFVCAAIERSATFDVTLVSLPTSWRDPLSVGVTRPASWLQGIRTAAGEWHGRPFLRVGAAACELEFQRYRPRAPLARALADCDVVQVVAGLPAPAYAVCGLGKPVAVHCATRAAVDRRTRHEVLGGTAELCRRAMTRVIDSVDRLVLQRADVIQVMNPQLLEYARRVNAGRAKPIRLVPPGVDTARFVPAVRRDCGVSPYVLSVSRLDDPRKNVGLLLQAYAALARRVPAVRLVLAGSAPPPPAVWRDVDRLGLRGAVSYAGAPDREALVALYQGAAVFALTSDEEGFGMVVPEAMACGVPVVSTACGGPDGIVRDGVDGYLVPVRDAAALAERFERLVCDADLNRRMSAAAREAVLARFDARHAGQTLLEDYDHLLAGAAWPRHRPS